MSAIATMSSIYGTTIPIASAWGIYTNQYVFTGTGSSLEAEWLSDTSDSADFIAQTTPSLNVPSRPDNREQWDFTGTANTLFWNNRILFVSPTDKKTEWSMTFWFKVQGAGLGKKIIGLQNGVLPGETTAYDRNFYVGTDQRLYFGAYRPRTNSSLVVSSTGVININEWYMATIILFDGNYSLYLNQASFQGNLNMGTADNDQAWVSSLWTMGGNKLNGWTNGSDGYWTGSVHSVYIWTRAITQNDMITIFQNTRNWKGKI